MLHFVLDKDNIGLSKGQIRRKTETQSLWVLRERLVVSAVEPSESKDSRVAEETINDYNPKVLPLGFLFLAGIEDMRPPRVYKEGTVYYITARASNNELLFRDEGDYLYLLDILKGRKQKYNFKLYAYCLLSQHYHLLIEPMHPENLSKIMQAINTSYSLYFNNKYKRSGHLLGGRFEGRMFNKDAALLEQSIHLHLNPLRLGVTRKLEDYKWSSYQDYIKEGDNGMIDKELISAETSAQMYMEQVQEKAAALITEKATAKASQRNIGYKILAVAAIAALLILPQLMHKPKPNILSTDFGREMSVNLPEGLPLIKQQEKQVWELWKLGPRE